MKYGRLLVDLSRVNDERVDEPVFDLKLTSPMSVNGRPVSFRVVLSWEDVVAMYKVTRAIVERRSDAAQEMAKAKDSTPFKEIEG